LLDTEENVITECSENFERWRQRTGNGRRGLVASTFTEYDGLLEVAMSCQTSLEQSISKLDDLKSSGQQNDTTSREVKALLSQIRAIGDTMASFWSGGGSDMTPIATDSPEFTSAGEAS
ncbi:MAG: hypothetical protein WBA10_04310, partial [Elainellaceae cyanobacterium]